MAKQFINIGLAPNDNRGDPLRIAFNKINNNFDELYLISNAGSNIFLDGNSVVAANPGGDINLVPLNGSVILQSDTIVQGTLTLADAVNPSQAITLQQATNLFALSTDINPVTSTAIVGGALNDELNLDMSNSANKAFILPVTASLAPVITINFLNPPAPSNIIREIDIIVRISAGVTTTLNWPSIAGTLEVKFPGNAQPSLSGTSLLKLRSYDGITYYAQLIGQGY